MSSWLSSFRRRHILFYALVHTLVHKNVVGSASAREGWQQRQPAVGVQGPLL